MRVSIHDSTTIEITSRVSISSEGEHTLAVYVVLPAQMARTYGRTQFFDDISLRTRFHTPRRYLFAKQLEAALQALIACGGDSYARAGRVEAACHFCRLYGNLLNRRLKQILLALQSDSSRLFQKIERFEEELEWFRNRVYLEFGGDSLAVPAKVRDAVRAVDEFISNRVFWVLGRQLRRAETSSSEHNSVENEGSVEYQSLTDRLKHVLKAELFHRRMAGYPCTSIIPDTGRRAETLARHSALKKYIAAPLFVHADRRAQEKVYRNYFAAIAAALAASWSFLADAQTYRMAQGQDFGFKTALLMALVVIAYVMKDRLKENSRDFLSARMNKRFPDYRSRFRVRTEDNEYTEFACAQESTALLSMAELPAHLQALYRVHHLHPVPGESPFEALRYDRVIKVGAHSVPRYFGQELKDILRFDISGLTRALDDSRKYLAIYGGEGEVSEIETSRIYYVDIVLSHLTDHAEEVSHYRLHLRRGAIEQCVELTPETILSLTGASDVSSMREVS